MMAGALRFGQLPWWCSNAEHRPMFRRPGRNGRSEDKGVRLAAEARRHRRLGTAILGRPSRLENGVDPMDLLRQLFKLLSGGAQPGVQLPGGRRPTGPQPLLNSRPFDDRPGKQGTRGVDELVKRLGTDVNVLAVPVAYRSFEVPKRGGGWRLISAPEPALRDVQRRILRRLLQSIDAHPAAVGFERGHSTVENASQHAGRAVVLRMDVKDFFGNTSADRVRNLYTALGWNREATDLLVRLTTHDGKLPQGAPTSPRLSNLVNRRLDARLSASAASLGAHYTRYADDLTFSFETDDGSAVHHLISAAKLIVGSEGYELHQRRKLHIRRSYERQLVSGLVVNVRPRLPRERRKWLRAVEHHAATGQPVSLSAGALSGWRGYHSMVEKGPS